MLPVVSWTGQPIPAASTTLARRNRPPALPWTVRPVATCLTCLQTSPMRISARQVIMNVLHPRVLILTRVDLFMRKLRLS